MTDFFDKTPNTTQNYEGAHTLMPPQAASAASSIKMDSSTKSNAGGIALSCYSNGSQQQNNHQANGSPASMMLKAADIIAATGGDTSVGDSFYIVDIGACVKLYQHLVQEMPRVTPHYAVKCFPNPMILAALANEGAGFDTASKNELEMVMKLGVDASSRVVFANPCKRACDLAAIAHHQVQYTTFDSTFELDKIKAANTNVGGVLRIRADDPKALIPFGSKYGALASEVLPLIEHAVSIGVVVCGVSFHVGSGAGDADAYTIALSACRAVYDIACQVDDFAATRKWVVDIGGGFNGGFDKEGQAFVGVGDGGSIPVADTVNKALDRFFPEGEFPGGLHIISEPGRYLATFSACLVTRVIGKRVRTVTKKTTSGRVENSSDRSENGNSTSDEVSVHLTSSLSNSSISSVGSYGDSSDEEQQGTRSSGRRTARSAAACTAVSETVTHYYIGDGTYGAFNAMLYDGWLPSAIPFTVVNDKDNVSCVVKTMDSPGSSMYDRADIFGPTCDSLDMVYHNIVCPSLDVGDWLIFPHCGAYTSAGACDFNGIPATAVGGVKTHYVSSKEFSHSLFPMCEEEVSIVSSIAPMQVVKNF